MFRILFLLFLVVPLVEIYLLIKVGGLIGALPTVFLVVFTAVLGAFFIRLQGFSTFTRVQGMLRRGEIPAIEVLEGVVLLICGALLLTPGFFTDTLGFLALVPPLRRAVILWALRRSRIVTTMGGGPQGGPRGDGGPRQRGPHVIEGEYRRED